MKKIKCKSCGKKWYLDNGEENYLKVCPFCEKPLKEKQKLDDKKDLGTAIYYALSERGIDMLASVGKISGFLYDSVPELKKEIKIFAKTFDEDYLAQYRDTFNQDIRSVELTLSKLREIFIEEEGLSEAWADMLCANCYQAVMYYRGDGLPEIMIAEVSDWEIASPEPQIVYVDRIVEEKKESFNSFDFDSTPTVVTGVTDRNKPDDEYEAGLQCEMDGKFEDALVWSVQL